jgi:glutathione synthase/RimK-type ligase-like ATP-grasp enzyme
MDAVDCNRGAEAAPAPSLLLLLGGLPPGAEDNATFIHRAFTGAGWTVRALHLDTLRLGPTGPLAADRGASAEGAGTLHALKSADLIWILGFGSRSAFLDKSQILQSLEGAQAFVSQPSALHLYHSKYPFPATPTPFPHPESYASGDAAWLKRQAQGGGRWVLKPPAGSFGAEVSFWDGQDPALGDALIQATESGRYALLQREIKGAEEWRILVAGDRVLGAYERRPGTSGGGWNLAAGGTAHLTPLPRDLATRAQALGLQLAQAGIGYAGIDIRGGMLLEANVINPGGLATLAALGQPVANDALVSAVTAAAQHRNRGPVLTP